MITVFDCFITFFILFNLIKIYIYILYFILFINLWFILERYHSALFFFKCIFIYKFDSSQSEWRIPHF